MTILAVYILIVTAAYNGSMAPGQSSVHIETPYLSSKRDCDKAGAKWERGLKYIGARDIEVQCKAMGR